MIFKVFRMRAAAGPKKSRTHIFVGVDNLEVRFVKGTPADLDDIFSDARAAGKTYAARHIIIAPREPMTIAEMVQALDDICAEYGLDVARAIIVAHHKARVEPGCHDWHLHAMLPDWDPASGRVHDNHNNYLRNELVARLVEARHHHPFVLGAHHAWVVSELNNRGQAHIAKRLVEAFPLDTQRPRSSLAPDTIQALKAVRISAAELRKFVRETWRDTADAASFREKVAARGITIERGTGTPPVWVARVDGLFLFTVAGGLPGVRVTTINARLGEPDHEHSREANPDPAVIATATDLIPTGLPKAGRIAAAAGGDADHQQSGRAQPQDGSDHGGPVSPTESPTGGGRHAGASGTTGSNPAAPQGRRDGAIGKSDATRGGHRIYRTPERRDAPAHGRLTLKEADLIRLNARHNEIAEIARIARLAAEPPRIRLNRILDEIEAAATDIVAAAATPLPEPASVTEAKKAVEAAYGIRSKTFDVSQKAYARYKETTDTPEPRWWNKKEHVAKVNGLYGVHSQAQTAVEAACKAYDRALAHQTAAIRAADGVEAKRQAHAKPYSIYREIVMEVRTMVARSPRLAARGAPALLAEAAERREVNLLDWTDLWGVPHPVAGPLV
jgi:hypothetical protein